MQKNKTIGATLFLALVFVFLPCVVSAQVKTPAAPRAEIEAGFPLFPPYGFTNSRGQPDGLDVRVTRAIFSKLGVPWRPAIYPAARLFKNLQDGTNMFSILVHVPALDPCCLYSKNPVMRDELRVYYAPGKPAIKSKEDLLGKSIITIRGFSYGGLLSYFNDDKNHITNNTTPSHDSALAMLRAGRADYVVFYGAAAKLLGPAATADLKYGVIADLSIYLVLNKTYPDAVKTMAQMEAIVDSINKDDLYKPFHEWSAQ